MARVLIVDDAEFMLMTIQRMLETNGHSVAGLAVNGIEAIKMYPEVKPDVVILDITMPQMNGIDTLKRLKVLDPDVRIIICSAIGYQEKIAEAISCGAEEFIVKPFEAEVLIGAIEKVMRK